MSLPAPDPEIDRFRRRVTAARAALEAGGWAVAGAVCTGLAGGVGFVVASAIWVAPLSAAEVKEGVVTAAVLWAGIGTGCGFLIGGTASFLRWEQNRGTPTVVRAGIGAGTGAVGGGLTPVAVVLADGLLPAVVSFSLAWAIAGLLAGLAGYFLSRGAVEPAEDDEEDEEATARPAIKGVTWTPREGTRRTLAFPILRLVPILTVSVFALVAAAFLAPSSTALALLAIGLLGLSVIVPLHSQERRLLNLERRFRGESEL